jgi:hypothetical protein
MIRNNYEILFQNPLPPNVYKGITPCGEVFIGLNNSINLINAGR